MRKSVQYPLGGAGRFVTIQAGWGHYPRHGTWLKARPEIESRTSSIPPMSHCIHLTAVDSGEFNFKYYYSTLGTKLRGTPCISFLIELRRKTPNAGQKYWCHFFETAVRMLFQTSWRLQRSECSTICVTAMEVAPCDLAKHSFTWWPIEDFVASATGAVTGMWGANAIKLFKSITL